MRVYVTKYALTQGIFLKEVEDCGNGTGMVREKSRRGLIYRHGEYALSGSEAQTIAGEIRDRKIKSLEKQLKKLQSMHVFPVDKQGIKP